MDDDKIIFAKIKTLDDLEGEEWRNVRNHKHYFISNLSKSISRHLKPSISPLRKPA